MLYSKELLLSQTEKNGAIGKLMIDLLGTKRSVRFVIKMPVIKARLSGKEEEEVGFGAECRGFNGNIYIFLRQQEPYGILRDRQRRSTQNIIILIR